MLTKVRTNRYEMQQEIPNLKLKYTLTYIFVVVMNLKLKYASTFNFAVVLAFARRHQKFSSSSSLCDVLRYEVLFHNGC